MISLCIQFITMEIMVKWLLVKIYLNFCWNWAFLRRKLPTLANTIAIKAFELLFAGLFVWFSVCNLLSEWMIMCTRASKISVSIAIIWSFDIKSKYSPTVYFPSKPWISWIGWWFSYQNKQFQLIPINWWSQITNLCMQSFL